MPFHRGAVPETSPGLRPGGVAEYRYKCWCRAESARPSQTLALLRRLFPGLFDRVDVNGEICEKLEGPLQTFSFFAKDNLVASPEYFDLASADTKLLRQTNRLAVTGSKNTRPGH